MKKEPSKSKERSAVKDVLALDDFRNDPSIDDQAVSWFVKLSDKSNKLEHSIQRKHFFAWLAEDPAHGTAFEKVATVWSIAGEAASKPVFQPVPKYRQTFVSLASAAALAVVAVLVLMVSPDRYTTNPGEQQRIVLSDGSTAFLNTDSAIEVQIGQNGRNVELVRGEAWFDVVRDPHKPFTVTSGDVSAKALGTAYAVRKLPNEEVFVTVTDGLVAVGNQFVSTNVAADQQVRLNALHSDALAVENIDPTLVLAWQRGYLVYQDVTLDSLLADLNRYVSRNIVLSDDDVGQSTVSAVIQIADQEAMLDALGVAMGLNWKAVSEELILVTPRAINASD